MADSIKIQKITIDGENFDITYIIPNDMYIVTPYIENKNIQHKLLEKFKLDSQYKTHQTNPEKWNLVKPILQKPLSFPKQLSKIKRCKKYKITNRPNLEGFGRLVYCR